MWADNEAEIDLLGFDFLVDGLVVALTEPRLLPLTVGVLGDWGSGKSSLMRIAADELREIQREPDSEGEPAVYPYLIVEFSPWQYEDHEDVKVALMTTVLDALATRLPEAADEVGRLREFITRLKRWGRRIGRAGTSAAPTVLPIILQGAAPDMSPEVAGILTAGAGAAAKEVNDALAEPGSESASEGADEPLPIGDIKAFRKEFEKLVASIPGGESVVVFIDDLDRCLPETVVDTFEAIRLFLNTPKTAYVLALNQNVVESAIDSRYPDLRKADGGGIGRDYLEKMLQLKVSIPALSAAEAETYINLLFGELHLPPEKFDKALATVEENRKASGLSVAFNTGIAGEALGDIPDELAADLGWAAEITPILGSSLRGNPRQLKRFLNNLLLKHRSAARRDVKLKLPVLAKLMVLEDQYNTDFQKLFDWEMATGGKCPEIATAESHARAGSLLSEPGDEEDASAQKEPTSTKAEPGVKRNSSAKETAPPPPPSDAEAWADKPHIAEWLRAEPPFKGVDLRPYFTYSRDKLSFGVSASRLAPHLQQLLTNIQSDVDQNRRSHYSAFAALEASERAQFIEALLDRVRRQPDSVAMTAAIELAEQNPDVVQPICEALVRIPTASIAGSTGTSAVRRLPRDHAAVIELLNHWEASENSGLKTLVSQARKAQAKKGASRGHVG